MTLPGSSTEFMEAESTTDSASGFSGGDQSSTAVVGGNKFAGLGPLLEQPDPKKVAAAIQLEVTKQRRSRKRRRVQAEANKLALQGVRGVRVRRNNIEDYDDVDLFVPLGAYDLPRIMDRSSELLEKIVSNLNADPAVPDPQPATDEDVDRDAAEFTGRLLTAEGAESGFNNTRLMRRAGRKAGFWGSAFLFPNLDPQGGGFRPMEVLAHPKAQTKDDAQIDPETGLDAAEDTLVKRYVRADGSLTDRAYQAQRQWMPKLKGEILTPDQLVLLPETCSGIEDAIGMIVIRWTPLGQMVSQFNLGTLSEEQKEKLVNWDPEDAKQTKKSFAKGGTAIKTDDAGTISDSAMCASLSLYYISHGKYPKGAYICVAGEDMVLHKATHSGMVETDNGLEEEMLELPASQIRQLDDDVHDDPMGTGIVAELAPNDEVRGEIILAWLEYLDRFNRPHTFLPVGSIIQPDALATRDQQPILYNPMGKPEQEVIPNFPGDAKEFFDRAGQAQDSRSTLEATAQGVDSPNSQSGVAKMAVIQQAHVNLTTMRQNQADGQERWWRIVTQMMRVYYTVPMLTKFTGEDGSYKEKQWTRADLRSTKDIRIARGSFTQQSPEQKQAELDARFAQQLVTPEEYERLSNQNLQRRLGYQDNPHRMRVRSQIVQFRQGPPEGFDEAAAQFEQATVAFQTAGANIQAQVVAEDSVGLPPVAAPAPPPPPVDGTLAMNPFADTRDVDHDQDVAQMRYMELRREMASKAFGKKHPKWQQFLIAEATLMRQDAGLMRLVEQQQAAQAAADQQRQDQIDAEAAKAGNARETKQMDIGAKRDSQDKQLSAKAQEQVMATDAAASASESQRAADAAENEQQRRFELEREAMRNQGAPMLATQ